MKEEIRPFLVPSWILQPNSAPAGYESYQRWRDFYPRPESTTRDEIFMDEYTRDRHDDFILSPNAPSYDLGAIEADVRNTLPAGWDYQGIRPRNTSMLRVDYGDYPILRAFHNLYVDLLLYAREDYRDFESRWIGQWRDIQDRSTVLSFEWTTPTEDVFGTVPSFTTVTKNVPVVLQVPQTVYRSEPIVEQQTVLVTERIEQTLDGLPSATFANESLRAGQLVSIDVAQDAGLIGLTRATAALGEITVRAGRDVTLDGEVPEGAAAGTKAAVADLQAGLRVDVQGGRDVLMKKDAILKADDGDAETETGVIRLKAGQTLTVESDAFGGHEIFLHSDGDVLMQSKMTSGHLIDVQAGLGVSGVGSVVSSIETDLETLGSEINLAAGINGGNLLLTNAAILTAGPITLSAPAGSLIHSGGQILADSLSAVVKNGITANLNVRTISANVTGTGDLNLTTSGSVVLANVTVASGSVSVAGSGDITAQNVTTLGGSGNISLSSNSGDVTLGRIAAAGSLEAATHTGEITSLPGGLIAAAGGTSFAGPVTSALPLTSNDITLITRQAGDVVLNYTGTGPLTLRQVHGARWIADRDHAGRSDHHGRSAAFQHWRTPHPADGWRQCDHRSP
jgi:hypothetical protein